MISACILTRDDQGTLEACLQSIRPHVDQLCILDTGSTDSSPQIAKRYADKFAVFLDCNDPATELIQDFAMARNRCLEMATGDCHWWQDADDVVTGAEHLRSLADSLGPEALVLVAYEYDHDAQGRPTCIHFRENLVKPRDKWRWSIPVHEVLLPQGFSPQAQPTNLVRRIHRKKLSTRAPDPERNLRILKRYVGQVGEGDVRAWYYLGVEYSMRGDLKNALRVLRRYVELAGWTDEKCLALLEIARVYQRMGDLSIAVEWAQRAILTKSWPEPYWIMAECFYELAADGIDDVYNAKRSMHFAELGLSLPETETVLFVNPMKRWECYGILHQLYARFGMIEKALEACQAGLKGIPENVEMQKRALQYEHILTQSTLVRTAQRSGEIAMQLNAHGLLDLGQWGQVQAMVGQAIGVAPQLAAHGASVVVVPEQAKADGCLDVVFFLGQGYEPWNPVTLAAGGMGGSETMAWELSKRLRSLGHRVRIFGHCNPDQEGVFDGVEYLNWDRYVGTKCDVLVSSRRPDAADPDVKAGARLLWVHDVNVGMALTPARALRFDRIIALSQWHKQHLLDCYAPGQPALVARLRPEQIEVTRNGVDPQRFAAQAHAPLQLGEEPGGMRMVTQHPPEWGGGQIPRWEIPGSNIIIGGSVIGEADWAALVALGVTHCASITDPPDIGVPASCLLHDPTLDDGTPFTAAHIGRVVKFARECLAGGGKLYLHCWVGASRSPSFAYAVLRGVYDLSAADAMARINAHYPWGYAFGSDAKHQSYITAIDVWKMAQGVGRNPKRVVYSSSPDRGLQTLLEMWPAVLKEEPEAELHVFYGFEGWTKTAQPDHPIPFLSATALRQVKHMMRSLPRVHAHGRVNQAQLAGEFLVSGVWAYPTWFSETSCITAMEAQAAGLYPIATPIAALNETVADRGTLVVGGWASDAGPSDLDREAFVLAVVQAIRGENQPRTREELQAYARENFDLDSLAKEWDAMLRRVLDEVTVSVVPRWVA